MKLKKLFVAAFVATFLVSCTQEVKIIDNEDKTGTARIQVDITPNVATLRAASAAHSDLTPTADELKIYNYALFIFNASGMLEASLIAMPYSSSDPNGEPDAYDYASTDPNYGLKFDHNDNPALDENDVLTLSSGTKMFFAIVNAPKELLAVQTEYLTSNTLNRQSLTDVRLTFDDLSAIVGAYNVDANGNSIGETVYFKNPVSKDDNNRGFMMTTLGTAGYEERVLTESVDENDITPISLSVGRAMAKVSLASELSDEAGDNPGDQPNGTFDVKSYKIINNPKQMFVMPNITNGILTTPYYYDERVRTTITGEGYFESHNSSHNDKYVSVSTQDDKTFAYAIENGNLNPKQGNATIAIVKGVFTPGGNAVIYESPLSQTTTTTIAEGATFYRIWIPLYERVNPSTGIGTGEIAGGLYDGFFYSKPISPEDLADYIVAEKASREWPDDIQLTIETFEDGICYYRLPLYNSKNSMDPYTVKRNSYYKIDIVSVSDVGYPGENGGEGDGNKVDPQEPLEPQTNITINITVDEWDEVEQKGNL